MFCRMLSYVFVEIFRSVVFFTLQNLKSAVTLYINLKAVRMITTTERTYRKYYKYSSQMLSQSERILSTNYLSKFQLHCSYYSLV